jgi:uncharacterized damage-inducible protein DinB
VSTTLLDDAFGHHVWASERLIDACADLTPEQLATPVPGTYGTIFETFLHLVSSDAFYLSVISSHGLESDPRAVTAIKDLRPMVSTMGEAWRAVLAQEPDPRADVIESEDGLEFHAPFGIRLAQAIHHGTDHRSQICTALTNLGIEPPNIDVWAYGEAIGSIRDDTSG